MGKVPSVPQPNKQVSFKVQWMVVIPILVQGPLTDVETHEVNNKIMREGGR